MKDINLKQKISNVKKILSKEQITNKERFKGGIIAFISSIIVCFVFGNILKGIKFFLDLLGETFAYSEIIAEIVIETNDSWLFLFAKKIFEEINKFWFQYEIFIYVKIVLAIVFSIIGIGLFFFPNMDKTKIYWKAKNYKEICFRDVVCKCIINILLKSFSVFFLNIPNTIISFLIVLAINFLTFTIFKVIVCRKEIIKKTKKFFNK